MTWISAYWVVDSVLEMAAIFTFQKVRDVSLQELNRTKTALALVVKKPGLAKHPEMDRNFLCKLFTVQKRKWHQKAFRKTNAYDACTRFQLTTSARNRLMLQIIHRLVVHVIHMPKFCTSSRFLHKCPKMQLQMASWHGLGGHLLLFQLI